MGRGPMIIGAMRAETALALVVTALICGRVVASPPSPRAARPAPALSIQKTAASLEITPGEVVLAGPRARHALLVTERRGERLRDVTHQATYTSLDAAVARVSRDGVVTPVADGEARIRARLGLARPGEARVRVRDARAARPISFTNDVLPVLTRAGCNQGACHGAQYGKGGFKLSLLGYDPDLDHNAIVKEAEGRRVLVSDPEHSLLLLKPTAQVPHGGGQRFPVGSPEYQMLLAWLRQSAPGPQPKDPSVTSLAVFPPARVMDRGGKQQLLVEARYSDGSVREVTAAARLTSLNDGLAPVSPTGEVSALQPGETAIMVRYQGQATIARITVPYAHLARYPALPRGSFIDDLALAKWRQLGLVPSPPCTDAEFIRRAMLDAIGALPAPDEVRAFLADRSPDKRSRLIDALLERPEFVDYWALKWGDLLRCTRTGLGDKGMWSFYNWIRTSIRENKPADKMARELLTAQGSTYTDGPSNYYRVARNPQDLAETTSQVFLGVRLQCARCHHHPFEKWSQDDYYSLAAFFARVGLKGSQEFGLFGGEQVVRVNPTGEVTNPKTRLTMKPAPPDGPAMDDASDRRRALAQWLTSKENPFFARNLVNRYWGMLMGRGIVQPVDDMRVTNPPANPELLDALAADLIAHQFDLKHLIRTVMNSRVYQLSGSATRENRADDVFFSHYLVKRLGAETLLDAIDQATGTLEKFPNLPLGFRAVQLPDPGVNSYFLDVFGRPPRQIACECERSGVPNIAQALQLMNGDLINQKVAAPEGRLAKLLASEMNDIPIVRELYLAALSRWPTASETFKAAQLVHKAPSRTAGFEDLLWTLLNTREFVFNH